MNDLAIDHPRINMLNKACTIDVTKYGDQLVELLSVRKVVAMRIGVNINNEENKYLNELFDYYNHQIKLILGL